MSYCVNCGVELTPAAKSCPLCDTPVINPNLPKDNNAEPSYPQRIEIPKSSRKRYFASIISILMLIPNIVCIFTNLMLTPEKLWSVFVVSSSLMVWFLFVFPTYLKDKYKLLIVAIDAVVTALYMFVFFYVISPDKDWFWKLAIPLDIGVFLAIGFLTAYFSKERTNIKAIITVFTTLLLLNIFICIVVNIYNYSVYVTYFTTILAISCLILDIFFCIADKKPKLKAWLSRKFFY